MPERELTPWLTPDEVQTLTDRKRWSAQARALRAMGYRFILSAHGRPLVERRDVFKDSKPKPQQTEPDWSKLKTAA